MPYERGGDDRCINSIADLRDIARRRLPLALFDYIDRGSYDEHTLHAQSRRLRALLLRQRVMADVSRLSLETTVLGERWSMPVGIAPTGPHGPVPPRWRNPRGSRRACRRRALLPEHHVHLFDRRRERRDQRDALVPAVLHARSHVHRGADVPGARGRCPVLVLTLDLPLQALRRRDPKNGLAVPPRLTLKGMRDFLRLRTGS